MSRAGQVAALTAGAALLVGGLFLPWRSPLTYQDFLATGPGSLEFCDPANPRFLTVAGKTAPATLTAAIEAGNAPGSATPATSDVAGLAEAGTVSVELELRTATERPISRPDLADGSSPRVLIVDESLAEFHRLAPEPTDAPGRWRLTFTPGHAGRYRVFADFTPKATGKELYASADLVVAGSEVAGFVRNRENVAGVVDPGKSMTLTCSQNPIPAREPVHFSLDAGPSLDASLVLFDRALKGFVFLRPLDQASVGAYRFAVTVPDPGDYVAWATVGRERGDESRAFPISVAP